MKTGFVLVILLLGAGVQSGFATTTFVSSRSGLSGSDSLSISSIGGDGTTEPSSGFVSNTADSNPVTISDPGADGFMVLEEGNDWSGNFANDDLVLWTSGDAVPTTLAFGTAVGGVGMQIQPSAFGAFTASISAYDASSALLGTFTEAGTSNDNNDNSAIFIGVQSSSGNIASIVINITIPAGTDDYAFNELTFGAPSSSSSVPEPSSLALLLCGAGLFTAILLKRRGIVQQ